MNVQNNVITFNKTDELFGGFSNMCGDFPIVINGHRVRTCEHLYQALKFSAHSDIQKQILEKPTPMAAKLFASKREHVDKIRKDWALIQLEIMDYCLRIKLIYHWVKLGDLLKKTETRDIFKIEARKTKSPYWGVVPEGTGFRGENQLGKLLMRLRNELLGENNEVLRMLVPPPHLNLMFLGSEIQTIDRRRHLLQVGTRLTQWAAEMRP